jgi:hypothetical protein
LLANCDGRMPFGVVCCRRPSMSDLPTAEGARNSAGWSGHRRPIDRAHSFVEITALLCDKHPERKPKLSPLHCTSNNILQERPKATIATLNTKNTRYIFDHERIKRTTSGPAFYLFTSNLHVCYLPLFPRYLCTVRCSWNIYKYAINYSFG